MATTENPMVIVKERKSYVKKTCRYFILLDKQKLYQIKMEKYEN